MRKVKRGAARPKDRGLSTTTTVRTMPLPRRPVRPTLPSLLAAAVLAGCAAAPEAPLRKETLLAVTDDHQLIRVNAGQPQHVLERKPLQGLPAGEVLLGMDFRVARGVLYTLSSAGRLYTLDVATATLKPVGSAAAVALPGRVHGVDFNPVADRVRVVSDSGLNLRLHPDTGAVAATDPALQYADGDARAGQAPRIAAAGYTYNKSDDKATTNYAIDIAAGALVTQGTKEGVQPAVSPNTGRLFTVGALGTGALEDASLDISDRDNTALAALRQGGRTQLYLVDLASGRARALGSVGDGRALRGIAIEP